MARKQNWRGRAGREKEQQNYKSDQVSQSRQQEEYKMSAVKAETEETGRAAKEAVEYRGFPQEIIFKTTNQLRALSQNTPRTEGNSILHTWVENDLFTQTAAIVTP